MVYIIQYQRGGGYVLAAAAQTAEQATETALDCARTDLKLYGYTPGYIIADEAHTFARVLDSLTSSPRLIQYSSPARTVSAVKRAIIAQSGFFQKGGVET